MPPSKELGISQIVRSPIAQGVLTGEYLPGGEPPAGSRATDTKGGDQFIKRLLGEDVLTAVQRLRPIADELGITMAQLAVAWVLQNDNVAAAIIGASRPEQVVDNMKASGVTIPAELLARVDEALAGVAVTDPGMTAKNAPPHRVQR